MTDTSPSKGMPAEALQRVAALLDGASWRFAKTMPENPHEYTLRREWTRDEDFVFVVEMIRRYGYVELYRKTRYLMLNVNGFKYWTMGAPLSKTILINRKALGTEEDLEAPAT